MMNGELWAPEEEMRLLRAFDAGDPAAQIAVDHGRTKAAIITRLQRLGRLVYLNGAYYAVAQTPYYNAHEKAASQC